MPTSTLPRYVLPQGIDKAADYAYYVAQFPSRPPTEGGVLTPAYIPPYILRASQAIWPITVNADLLLEGLASLGVSLVNPAPVHDYLARHTDLTTIVGQMAREVCQALRDVRLSLELVHDPEDTSTETLVLYLHPTEVQSPLFEVLRSWNRKVAEQTMSSEGWFIINLDLRRQV